MSEQAVITVTEGVKKDNGWYEIKDGNDLVYSTKKSELGVAALALQGKKAEIEFTVTQKDNWTNRYIESISEHVESTNADTPPLGTGQYIKGKEAPETQRSILASVALKEANLWLINLPEQERSVLSEQAVLLVANKFFDWLRKRAEGEAIGETTSPSSDLPL